MRALIVLVTSLIRFAAAGGEELHMPAEDDVIHLATMAAPPWTVTAREQVTSDHAGFEVCEQLVKTLISRSVGEAVAAQTYTTSPRWGKVLRAKIAYDGGGAPGLVTCWIGADGRASVVFKIDDGEP